MIAQMSVQFILALISVFWQLYLRKIPFVGMTGWAVNSIAKAIKGSIPFLPTYTDPSAGIGRQDNLKIYWYLS
jgi:hypothetical protein